MSFEQEIPRQFEHKPELELVWRGLVISISSGFMSRKQAYDMLARFDAEDGKEPTNVYDLDSFRNEEPPDLVA